MAVQDKTQVAIMGAGAAGTLLAARLAAAGKSVVVLDAGPPWTMADLVSSQIWARRLKWGGAPVMQAEGGDRVGHNMGVGWGFGGSALASLCRLAAPPRSRLPDAVGDRPRARLADRLSRTAPLVRQGPGRVRDRG
jgi:choline dehydrogenase-like flavoprotein